MDNQRYYVALLRGINVGGKSIIAMQQLKACFEELGLHDVTTYANSGNVIFRSDIKDGRLLAGRIERALVGKFDMPSKVLVLSQQQLQAIVDQAPKGFGEPPGMYRPDVVFLMGSLTAGEVMPQITLKEGVDTATGGDGVIYFARLKSRATESRLSRIIAMPWYKETTIRTWGTVGKILSLMDS